MLTLLKLTILGILFIISGGMFFSQHFREHKLLIFSAAIVATLGSIYLFRDVCEDVEICAEFMDESSNGNGEQLSESKGNNKPIEKPEVSVVPEESSFEPKKDLKVKIDVEKLESDAKKSDFSGYFKPQKGMFETTANFQARREELLKLFNYQVGNRNLAYQVGTVHLEKYDADNQVFAVNLDWQANWLKPFFSDFSFEKEGRVKIGINAAEQIYKEGKEKSLFVMAELVGNSINIQPVMVEKGAIYPFDIGAGQIEVSDKIFQDRSTSSDKQITVSGRTYIAYDNGTALDTETGLMWMRCLVGQTWTGSTCSGEGKRFNWEEAKKQSANFAGHSDWRIPTIQELQTLLYCSSGKPEYFRTNVNVDFSICEGDYQRPTIAQSVFPNTPTISFVWSGSPNANDSKYAWLVDFFIGGDGYYGDRDGNLHVRLVRGGQ